MNTSPYRAQQGEPDEPGPQQMLMHERQRIGEPNDECDLGNTCCLPLCTVLCCICVLPCSFIQIGEREESVIQRFGRYEKTYKKPGLRFLNPVGVKATKISTADISVDLPKQKLVDGNGNPLDVSGVLIYRVKNSFKAAIDVENYQVYIYQQAQAVLKQVVSRYPYEEPNGGHCLKSEAIEISRELCYALQCIVDSAGLQVVSFNFNDLSYAPEIASQMLKRQQAYALVQARATIVQGAVDTAYGAMAAMEHKGINLSPESTEKLIVNLLTVMTSEKDATPTINV